MLQDVAVCSCMLQCVAVCCSALQHKCLRNLRCPFLGSSGMLQCVVVCLQCVAVRLQCAAVRCSTNVREIFSVHSWVRQVCVLVCCCVLLCVAVCCCVLLCVAVCCCVLLCVAVCCNVSQCVVVQMQEYNNAAMCRSAL